MDEVVDFSFSGFSGAFGAIRFCFSLLIFPRQKKMAFRVCF